VSIDGPTQSQVRDLHSRKQTVAEMARELGITPDRVRRVHSALNLLPWPGRGKAHGTGAQERESRRAIELRVATRRAAIGGYWRENLAATAADVAHALGYPIGDVRADRITLGLSIRRGPDSIVRLAGEGLAVGEIARRTGIGADHVRRVLDEVGASDTDPRSSQSPASGDQESAL
jgi:hypothetical protein